jgi:hypothetical protein
VSTASIAKQICQGGSSYRTENDRPSRVGPERNQDAGRYACGGPENGYALWFGQQCKAQSRRHEIEDANRDGQRDCLRGPRQIEAGRFLLLGLRSRVLKH